VTRSTGIFLVPGFFAWLPNRLGYNYFAMNRSEIFNLQVLTIIPAYNEEAGISGVLAGVRAHLPALVVDDGSSDDTAGVAEGAGQACFAGCQPGQRRRFEGCFRWALEQGYSAALTLDADGHTIR